ncbi:hypothetical protein M885DRAFT_103061 [Pelagophyceae sp. CCMP2097]|nr:hypothetical protein M885DRAFT_103061 [Pelagophyceae sp. CCMP2097]
MAHEEEVTLSLDAQGRVASRHNGLLDYTTRVEATAICDWTAAEVESLRTDVTVADCALLPRSFWVDATTKPRAMLESLAQRIVAAHTTPDMDAGGEWWVQRRPEGRAEILSRGSAAPAADESATKRRRRNADGASVDGAAAGEAGAVDDSEPVDDAGIGSEHLGLGWHVDKDEELLKGASVYAPPHLSTVTYVCDVGAPTVLLDATLRGHGDLCRLDGDAADELSLHEVEVVWPRTGDHLVFDGRRMHGVVPKLSVFEATKEKPRLTLLVNIWLAHRPLGVEPFPDCMINSLSPPDAARADALFGADRRRTTIANVRGNGGSSRDCDVAPGGKLRIGACASDAAPFVDLCLPCNIRAMRLFSGATALRMRSEPPAEPVATVKTRPQCSGADVEAAR